MSRFLRGTFPLTASYLAGVRVKESLLVSYRLVSPLRATALGALFLAVTLSCAAQDNGFSLDLHANSHATAKDIGLPAYPGAKPWKESDNDSSANLGLSFKDFHFTLVAASFETTDSGAKVLDYYRKPLAHYGEVLECYKGKPVGSLTVTKSGLTCDIKKDGSVEVNGKGDSSEDHELRAGTPLRFRIVGISDSKDGKTRFGLVYLELPKDSDSDSKN
jgi:hypothetical protein